MIQKKSDKSLAELKIKINKLEKEKSNRDNALDLLGQAASEISQQTDLKELLNRIVTITQQTMNVDSCLLFLLNEDFDRIVLQAEKYKDWRNRANYSKGEGLTGKVWETMKTIKENDVGSKLIERKVAKGKYRISSHFLGTPLISSSGTFQGVLKAQDKMGRYYDTISFRDKNGFTEKDKLIIEEKAKEISKVLERIKYVSKSKIIDRLLNDTRTQLRSYSCLLFIVDPIQNKIIWETEKFQELIGIANYKKGEGLTGKVWKNKATIKNNNVGEDRKAGGVSIGKYRYSHQFLGVPVIFEDKLLGVLKVRDKLAFTGLLKQEGFTELDIKVLEALALTVAVTIQNSRLLPSEREIWEILPMLVAHTIKTPLTTQIAGFDRLLEKYKMNNDIVRLRRYGVEALHQTQRFMAWNSRKKPTFERIDINNLIKETINFIPKVEQTINHSLDNNLPLIFADKEMIESVFRELLDNAIKYTVKARPGIIRITTSILNKNKICIEFSDNGIGMTQEMIINLFNINYHLKLEKGNFGLGMIGVHRMISLHNGYIKVKNNYPNGCVFQVFLKIN